eukprot:354746-Pyramimonas_sp.AAC.1
MPVVDNIQFDFDQYVGHVCTPMKSTARDQFLTERDHDSLGRGACAVELNEISARITKFGKLLHHIQNSSILILGGGHHFADRGN